MSAGRGRTCLACERLRLRTYRDRNRHVDRARGRRWRAAHPDRMRHLNARRIFVGTSYHSTSETPEQAARVNAHIRRRRHEFMQSQSARDTE